LGFVGRRNPHQEGVDAGPKYLNTPDTALFHKGAQLHIVREDLLAAGATPVLVEGPMDALAVTIAGQGQFVGVAP
jgi:DNA primase